MQVLSQPETSGISRPDSTWSLSRRPAKERATPDVDFQVCQVSLTCVLECSRIDLATQVAYMAIRCLLNRGGTDRYK